MHAVGLSQRFAKDEYYKDAVAVSLHPGAVRSELWDKMIANTSMMVWLQFKLIFTLRAPFELIGFKSEWRGAQTTL